MCNRAVSCSRSQKYSLGLTRALTFAVSEWILMFMLFIDACFSYLVTRFAYYCDLQGPCLICSRLDHVLSVKEKTGFYWDLICQNHKLEISSIVLERNPPLVQSLKAESRDDDDDMALEKFISLDTMPETFVQKLEVKEISNPHDCEELNWKQNRDRTRILITEELISFDEVSPSPNITENPAEVSVRSLDAPPVPGEMKSSVTESGVIYKTENEPISTTETSVDMISCVTTNGVQISSSLDLGDAYKLATIGSKGRQLSGKLLEQKSLKESARVSQDLKLLLSQLSFSRGFELSLNDLNPTPTPTPNPKLSWNGDEIKNLDTHLLQRRISLERNESGLSLDGSIVSEIEGESMVDRLNRQVEHDKKIMSALYKELEEERNASAVSTYQAMAMITRLQEEKAAFEMEALQCVRMMEEQAEYDGEALQRANELVAEKEKELLDMETKLHFYQKESINVQT